MKKYLIKKNSIIVISAFMLIICMVCFCAFLNSPSIVESESSEKMLGNDDIYNPVSPTKAKDFYATVNSNCDGVMILENSKISCKSNDTYREKMIGYSYEGKDLVIYVNVMRVENGHGYKVDGTDLGEYNEENELLLLNSGTTYLYTYKKIDNDYTFSSIKLM